MADKRKVATRKPARAQPVTKKRRSSAAVGRIARPREVSEFRTAPAMDEHSVQVRERIDAALAEAVRLREDISQRIAAGLYRESGFYTVPTRAPVTPRRSRGSRG